MTNAGPPWSSGPPYGSASYGADPFAPSDSGWTAAPPAAGAYGPAGAPYGGPAPWAPPRRSNNVVVIVAVVAAVVLAGGSFLAGRLTAPTAQSPAAASPGATNGGPAATGGASSTVPTEQATTGFTVSDSPNDAVPHPPSDGKIYGPSEIVSLSVRSDGTNLVITTEYSAATPMNLVSGATRIRLDPDKVPNCQDSVLASFDWSIDYDSGNMVVEKPGATCDADFQSTSITGAADVNGTTLTFKIAQASLGISPGQRIVVRACVSTRIDDSSTTYIQDWAPDGGSGTTGTV